MKEEKNNLDSPYHISKVTREEADQVIGLLTEIAKWIQDNKIDQWSSLAVGLDDDDIKATINQDQVYAMKRDGKMVATFTLYDEQGAWDKYLWGELSDNAIYVHRLAVALPEKGMGLGKKLLDWIEQMAKQTGITMIRLDCVTHNKKLNDFYVRCGYIYLGTRHGFSLYEKKLVE